jgi:hypothetical protein
MNEKSVPLLATVYSMSVGPKEYKKWCGKLTTANEYVFPSRANTPINYKNWLECTLRPTVFKAGLEMITFQMFRRRMASGDAPASTEESRGIRSNSDLPSPRFC